MHSAGATVVIPHSVVQKQYENLLIRFKMMIFNDILMWLKNGHFNNRAAKMRLGRDLQQTIHKVIHRFCG
jgi:hypothetical protein